MVDFRSNWRDSLVSQLLFMSRFCHDWLAIDSFHIQFMQFLFTCEHVYDRHVILFDFVLDQHVSLPSRSTWQHLGSFNVQSMQFLFICERIHWWTTHDFDWFQIQSTRFTARTRRTMNRFGWAITETFTTTRWLIPIRRRLVWVLAYQSSSRGWVCVCRGAAFVFSF